MEDYYEYLDSNGVTTLYKLIKDDTVALINGYSVTLNNITTNLDNHVNNTDIHTPISDIENMIDTKVSGLVNSAPETLDTLKELSDALGNDPNFATTVANQIGNKADKDSVYTKLETDTLLESKANSVHNHVVSDITDMPTIPTKTSELTNDSGYITNVTWEDVIDKPKLSQVAISGSYSDLNNTPTIPTKTSQLINDSGFLTSSSGVITSVSWSDITNKPNFSTVATSGSYTDLSNTPTIPTKVSQLENDTGFINALTDVVDTKSNQTIGGAKTFTVAPFVSNNATTNGYFIKLNTIARNEVPSTTYYSVLRTLDKNNEILGDYVVMKTDKGATNAQINIRSEDSNGNQLINALNFSMANDGSSVSFAPSVNNKVSLGTSTYKWAEIYSDDVVHTSGNETINGNKTFTQGIKIKNSDIDLTITPTSNKYSTYLFTDKNNANTASLQYSQRTYGVNDICFYVSDADSNSHGFRIRTDNRLEPIENNTYSLGSSSAKWSDVYSTNAYIDRVVCTRFTHSVNNGSVYITGGSEYDKGATLVLHGEESSDAGSFIINSRDKTRSLYLVGKPDGTLQWAGQNIALDNNLVHKSGNETINGTKMFSNTIHRYADLTTLGDLQVYRFDDTNANACGHIYNNVHWHNNAVYNRHGAYNAKSGKSMEIDIISPDSGVGMAYVSGTATKGNVEAVTSATDHRALATMGWVNNPATSTNVVHRSGDETIAGNKTFTNRVSFPSGYYMTTEASDNSLRIIRSGSGHGNNYKVIIQGDTGKFFAPNGFIGNLQGNADTATSATKASYLDNYSLPGGNRIYLDWDKQVDNYVGLKVDNTVMGGLITTKNIGSQAANSATYATTQATTDNSTKIATTAWVRTYVNSVVGSNTVGSSVSAYWSNSSNVTATGQSSSGGYYPECYSEYVSKTPVVGTIYSGAQLYTVINTYASATGSLNNTTGIYFTSNKAQATLSNPLSSTAKYLCTTANTFSFRAYTARGNTSSVGTSSVVNATLTKSIFIRVQ